MSPHRTPKISCRGKALYLTWEHAANDARQIHRKYGDPANVYRCRFCAGWHVGRARERNMK